MKFFERNFLSYKLKKESKEVKNKAMRFIGKELTHKHKAYEAALDYTDILECAIVGMDCALRRDDGYKYRNVHEEVSALLTEKCLEGKDSFFTDMVTGLIRVHHAVSHYKNGEIGWQECKAVQRIMNKLSAEMHAADKEKGLKTTWPESVADATEFIMLFFRAVNAGSKNPYSDTAVIGAVCDILDTAVNKGHEFLDKNLRKKLGPISADECTVHNLSQSTILGANLLYEMDFNTRQAVVAYLAELINNRCHRDTKRWPIKFIDLRGLSPYVYDGRKLYDIINHTMSRDVIIGNEKHIAYSITDGTLALNVCA